MLSSSRLRFIREIIARYRHPFAVGVKRDPVTRSATCIPLRIIPPIEQTKERLLVSKQLTTFARPGRPRSYQVTSDLFLIFRRRHQGGPARFQKTTAAYR